MKLAPQLLIIFLLAAPHAWAQSDLDQIEHMFSNESGNQDTVVKPGDKIPQPKEDLSEVRSLEPYKDIAVIEKRYMPKTGRFEAFAGAGGILNDAFFNNYEANLRLGYNFREAYGLEVNYMAVGTSQKSVTQELSSQHGVQTNAYVEPLSYMGAAFKWTPFYGKMTFLNHDLIHFDHYFTAGGGVIQSNQRTTPPTLQFGTGQIYALSKSWALRWDLTWLFYSSQTVTGSVQSTNNLFLTLGASFFFPEATYR